MMAIKSVQRVHPNTHCSGVDKSKGFSGSIQTLPFETGEVLLAAKFDSALDVSLWCEKVALSVSSRGPNLLSGELT